MNQRLLFMAIAAIMLSPWLTSFGQKAQADRLTVPLTDPSRPVFLKVSLISGSITVKGYSGKEVVVEAKVRQEEEEGADADRKAERSGLKRIVNNSTGLTVEEEDNTVNVGTGMRSASRAIDLEIQVPTNSSMKLGTVNDGDIVVQNVNGDLEVNNTNGNVELTQISGSAVAHALNGELKVTFIRVDPKKSMSFSSLNGAIDVTFPSDIKATLSMKSDQGEIYSDFDIVMEKTNTKVEEAPKEKKGKYRVVMEKSLRGTINGGGIDIEFKNFNGDIYIRKGK